MKLQSLRQVLECASPLALLTRVNLSPARCRCVASVTANVESFPLSPQRGEGRGEGCEGSFDGRIRMAGEQHQELAP